MKTKLLITGLTMLALSTLNSQLSTAFAQGSLTPPGPPAPTMKSADQIEPRTIVNAANTPGDANYQFIISQPGSYYLATNLVVSGKSGIEIATNNVTLDLSGFTLQCVYGGYGIIIPSGPGAPQVANITVRNGNISGWGNMGVDSDNADSINLVFERLNLFEDGAYGIYLAGPGVVRDCNIYNNEYGIFCNDAIISGCTADNNDGYGINCAGRGIISGCTADNNDGYGINCAGRGIISGCTADNNYYGIYVGSGTVSGCEVGGNKYSGIFVNGSGSIVIGNTCIGNNTANFSGSAGIYIGNKNTRVEDNHVTASGYAGIQVGSGFTNNIIIKNSVSGNGVNNYVLPGAQIVGPLITNTGTITNLNPWANFSY